ncbi:DUF4177 domain-containing protein [Bacillus sp. PS06]|uniref:DUF4177 domain-containing protein n=1 Tax=Bacillus sp. PS06 TaxID=2764176 RepID=UPI0017802057|nr:DUF4177 domain-containing protein [Bacillus sp. PS06]MBD8069482.1 DUF4177 domain-containing protein [Bacillus sp. PS06]
MTQFEYKTITLKPGKGLFNIEVKPEQIDETLNQLGEEGWKLVSSYSVSTNGFTSGIYYTFIRPTSTDTIQSYTLY